MILSTNGQWKLENFIDHMNTHYAAWGVSNKLNALILVKKNYVTNMHMNVNQRWEKTKKWWTEICVKDSFHSNQKIIQ